MTLRSPIVAMLWENWRLTRVEAAWKLAVGIVGGLAALVMFAVMAPSGAARDGGAVIALMFIVVLNITGWLSIPKINGKRPGFPFDLSTPVPCGRRYSSASRWPTRRPCRPRSTSRRRFS